MNSNFSSSPRGNFDRKPSGDRKSFDGPRKSFGDRPSFGDRKPSFGPRKSFGDRPSFGDRGGRPSFGDRKPSFGGDRGPRPSFGDRKPFGDRPSFGDRGPRPSFGDRKPFGDRPSFGDRGGRPSFGDRKPSFGGDRGGRPSFGDRKPFGDRGDRPSFGDRKPSFGDRGPRPSFGDRKPFGDRPSFGDRKPSFGGDRGGRPSFGDRKPFGDRAPRPSFDDRAAKTEDRFPEEAQRRVQRDFSSDFEKTDTSRGPSGAQFKDSMNSAINSEDTIRPRKSRDYMRTTPGSEQASKPQTSWSEVAEWYDNHLENDKDTYHMQVILPNLMRLIAAKPGEKVLEIGCGQGFFTRRFKEASPATNFEGIDIGEDLIAIAKKRSPGMTFTVGNAEDCSQYADGTFDTVYIVLAIQNIEHLDKLIGEASRILKNGGTFHIVMNHPAFRIPKETSWEYVDEKAIQARRVDAYLSEAKAEMDMHPGMFNSPKTLSFHRSMQTYFKQLGKFGFAVDRLEEWISHKVSDNGPRQDAENKARKEIPMFMYLRARKI